MLLNSACLLLLALPQVLWRVHACVRRARAAAERKGERTSTRREQGDALFFFFFVLRFPPLGGVGSDFKALANRQRHKKNSTHPASEVIRLFPGRCSAPNELLLFRAPRRDCSSDKLSAPPKRDGESESRFVENLQGRETARFVFFFASSPIPSSSLARPRGFSFLRVEERNALPLCLFSDRALSALRFKQWSSQSA